MNPKTSPPTPKPITCNSYVDCQTQYIKAMQSVNTNYRQLLESKDKPDSNTYTAIQAALNSSINQLRYAIDGFNNFLIQHSSDKTSSYSKEEYEEIRKMRASLKEQAEMLQSRFGAPKDYGQVDNLYDEYRMNYNSMVYLFIIVCLLATVLIFFLFRSI
jgi:hypothetical protein